MNNNKHMLKKTSIALISALLLQSCATGGGQHSGVGKTLKDTFNNDDPCANSKRNIGLAIGTLVGAVAGNKLAGKHKGLGTVVGAIAGAGIGGLIGASFDKRQCEISKIEKKYNADIQITPINTNTPSSRNEASESRSLPTAAESKTVGLSVNIVDNSNESQFKVGSDELNPSAVDMFSELANQYKIDPSDPEAVNRRVLLVGHTDDTGNTNINATLSEHRAKNVATLFKNAGIPESQIYYQGAGETMPYADNATEDGRNKNRRVEIVDLTDEDSFKLYLMNRRAKTEYYRSTELADARPPSTPANALENIAKERVTSADSKKHKEKPLIEPKTSSTAKSVSAFSSIDFGGKPITLQNTAINIGKLPSNTTAKFSLISEANANDIRKISSCNVDRPRVSGMVKSLKNNKVFSTSDYLPGIYDSSWAGHANGHLIALTHVAVLRDGNTLARKPDLMIYQDYKAGPNVKPTYKSIPQVNVYFGDQAVLYRVFDQGPVKCLDMIIPNNNPKEAPNSMVYYNHSDSLYAASFNPKLAK